MYVLFYIIFGMAVHLWAVHVVVDHGNKSSKALNTLLSLLCGVITEKLCRFDSFLTYIYKAVMDVQNYTVETSVVTIE